MQVRANMLGTAFSVYDGGMNPGKASDGAVRHELAAVEYVHALPPLDLEQLKLILCLVHDTRFALSGTRPMCWAPRAPA